MPVELRVLSWNVRHLRDDADTLARAVRALDPDVLCLQESPVQLRWRSKLAALARRTGLLYATGGRTAGDCALLTHLRVTVHEARDLLLPRRPGLHQRGLALAVVSRPGWPPLTVASAHLGLDEGERVEHAEEMLRALDGFPRAVLAGDLNEPPDGAAWQVLGRRLQDAHALAPEHGERTFPARAPRQRIDVVLVDNGIDVAGCGAVGSLPGLPPLEWATDHLPVLARLRC